MKLEYPVNSTNYKTIKEVLKSHFHISDRLLLKLKRANQIFLNEKPVFVHAPIHWNDTVKVEICFQEKSENILPIKMELDIVFEDEGMVILNKPAGIPIHPSMAHFTNSLSNGIQYYFEKNHIETKIRPVNRLDKDTSGLVIFAKNEYIQESLIRQMENHLFQKKYLAILTGTLDESSKTGIINANIARKEGSIIEREINPNGQKAITHYHLIQNFADHCLVEFQLETGRTHQIRVHSKYFGHPILGDSLYGTPSEFISRQALHSYKISFLHPVTKEKMKFEISLPEDMKKIVQKK